jgi:hypothetical protein
MSPSTLSRCIHAGLLLGAAVLALPGATRAGEAYYVLMFGSQRVPNDPDYSHIFATFVRATWPGGEPCPGPPRLEAHTISWLPRNLEVRTLALLPECGHNFELHETLRYALGNGERVSLWGPYRVAPELYAQALQQIGPLESGEVLYKANDTLNPSDRVRNCIHALSAVVGRPGLWVASPGWGETASYAVLRRYLPWVIDCDHTQPWVGSALGLDAYPLIYRGLEPPRSGAIVGPLYRLAGGESELQATYGPPPR